MFHLCCRISSWRCKGLWTLLMDRHIPGRAARSDFWGRITKYISYSCIHFSWTCVKMGLWANDIAGSNITHNLGAEGRRWPTSSALCSAQSWKEAGIWRQSLSGHLRVSLSRWVLCDPQQKTGWDSDFLADINWSLTEYARDALMVAWLS